MQTDTPERLAQRVAEAFERIHTGQMAGLPLLNNALSVQTLGFQTFEGRTLGMLITPWMMSLVLFPGEQDDWASLELGTRQQLEFPSGSYRFLSNVIEGLGPCQMHSLHSPMRRFHSQQAAVAEAVAFVNRLLVEPHGGVKPDPVDTALLGKILRGEHVPDLEPYPAPEPVVQADVAQMTAEPASHA